MSYTQLSLLKSCCCTVHVCVVIHFCDSLIANLYWYFLFFYIYIAIGDPINKRGRFGIPLTSPKPEPGFPTQYVMVFFYSMI